MKARTRAARVIALILLLMAAAAGVSPTSAVAFFDRSSYASPPWYSHAWYLRSDTPGYFNSLGISDGNFDMQYLCNGTYSKDAMAILDFGGIASGIGDGTFGNYGTVLFGGSNEPLDHIVGAVESYAQGWYNATSSCPRLNVAVGTNNSTPCGTSATCTSGGGGQWAAAVSAVNAWLVGQGYSWQIEAVAANDIESWSTAGRVGPARAFIDAYNSQTTETILNFGSAYGCPTTGTSGCSYGWGQADYQYVSWQGAAWPYPENYVTSGVQANQWANIKKNYYMFVLGVLSDEAASDPIPSWNSPNCKDNGGNRINCDTEAYTQMLNAMINYGVSQSHMDFLTNIRWT